MNVNGVAGTEKALLVLFLHLCIGISIVYPESYEQLSNCSKLYFYYGKEDYHNPRVITSHNYPFDYVNGQTCQYIIQTEYPQIVCLDFSMFNMTGLGSNIATLEISGFINDEYKSLTYSWSGTLYASSDLYPPYEDVWKENFCWESRNNLTLTFVTYGHWDQHRPGFYLEYYEHHMMLHHLSPKNETKDFAKFDQCSDGHWRCFSIGTCISNIHLCDGKHDCPDGSDESYTHARCFQDISLKACTFEESTCNLEGISHGWQIESQSSFPEKGPRYDHTKGDENGLYVVSKFDKYNRAVHKSVTLKDEAYIFDDKMYCLSFWYHMWGPDPGYLGVNLKYEFGHTIDHIWYRTGNLGNKWRKAEIQLQNPSGYYVIFEAISSTDNVPRIALDDISIREGVCWNDDLSCNFETDLCRWTIDGTNGWERTSGMADATPPDIFPSNGHYLQYEYTSGGFGSTTSVLVSPPISPNNLTEGTDFCLVFYYKFIDEYATEMTMRIIQQRLVGGISEKYIPLHQTPDGSIFESRVWSKAKVDIHVAAAVQLNLTPMLNYQIQTFVFDTVSLIRSTCDEITVSRCGKLDFLCSDDTCINGYNACDGVKHCPDGSDETPQACCGKHRCMNDQWCCYKTDSGHSDQDGCLPLDKYCDGYNDCDNWSDEDYCKENTTAECTGDDHLFACDNGRRCVNIDRYVCNGYDNCGDNSDEKNCTAGAILWTVFGVIILLVLLIFIFSLVSAYYWYKQQNGTQSRTIRNRRPVRRNARRQNNHGIDGFIDDDIWTSSRDDMDLISATNHTLVPPDYDSVVNTPHAPVNHSDETINTDEAPPSYDSIRYGSDEQRY